MQQSSQGNPLALATGQIQNGLVQEIRFQSDSIHRFHAWGWVEKTQQIAHGPQQVVTTQSTSLNVLNGGQLLNQAKVLPQRSQLTTQPPGSLSGRGTL